MESRERITIRLKCSDYEKFKKLSVKNDISMAELARKFILSGMNIEASKTDIDFIRENLREEIDLALDKSTNRISGLLYKAGIYSVTSALLNSEIIKNFVKVKDEADIEKYMNCKEKAIKEANIILHNTNKKVEVIAGDL